MSFVNVKCPKCGASIQLDSDMKEGFCSYCGSKIHIEEAISKIKIDKSDNLRNLLNLSKAALEASNGQEALDFANKILEINSQNAEAWYIKMKAHGLLAIFKDLKCNEVIIAGRNAIRFGNSSAMKKNVYNYFLNKCLNDLMFCMTTLQNTKDIKRLYDANCRLDAFKATKETLSSDTIADLAIRSETSILKLRYAVPNDEITNDTTLARLTGEVAKQWVYYQNSLNARFNIYGTFMNDLALKRYKDELRRIKEGLPQEQQNIIDGNSMTNESKNGCYIATAVYGSYDAPEVLILRHYRDYSLKKTEAGRMFIKIYYALSPTIANKLKKANLFNRWIKIILNKWVKHLHRKYHY